MSNDHVSTSDASDSKEKTVRSEHADNKAKNGFFTGFFKSLGNLPEFKVRGQHVQGRALRLSIGFIASCGFLMFGYDQGVLSSLLTLDDFQKDLPLMTPRDQSNDLCWLDSPVNTIPNLSQCTGNPNLQAFGVAIYQIGCLAGAIAILFYGEKWGRRSSTFWGSLVMIIGTIMQAASYHYETFAIGRFVGGIGNGMVTSTIPTWQSECTRAEKRGVLVMLSGALISGGIMIAYWVDYGFYFLQGTIRWRLPVAIQSIFTILVMIGLLFLPDSPRWLAMRGRIAEARSVTSRLAGKPEHDPDVTAELNGILEALHSSSSRGPFRFRELLASGPHQNLRRTLLAMLSQFGQQITGINLVTYYLGFVLETSLGFDQASARLWAGYNGTAYFVSSWLALLTIERFGRTKLMIFGAFGMMLSMAILTGATSTGATLPNGAPQLSDTFGYTAIAFLFVFNTFFAIGWLGTTWLYPAEICGLRIRIQANALSTATNWVGNFLIVMITPPAFASLGWRTYIIFAVINAALIPTVWIFFPEPKGRSLEELDIIFASAYREGVSPVSKAKKMAKITSGDEIDKRLRELFDEQDVERRVSTQ